MKTRRRLHMQLTPLLDLLLIVIFAQFMDVQEREATTVDEAKAAIEQRDLMAAELAASQIAFQRTTDRLAQLTALAEQMQSRNSEIRRNVERAEEDLDLAVAQQQLFGELVGELFNVPQETVTEALTPQGADGPASPEQQMMLKAKFRELSMQNSSRMIRHLLSFEEMRKRCDLWELHIDDTGYIMLHVDQQEQGFRARTPKEFAEKLYAAYKALPQPKSLVVIMLSWGEARGDVRDAALRGLPVVTEQMRQNAAGFIRFEYAILGYQQPPE